MKKIKRSSNNFDTIEKFTSCYCSGSKCSTFCDAGTATDYKKQLRNDAAVDNAAVAGIEPNSAFEE